MFNIRLSSEKPGTIQLKLNNILGKTIFSGSIQINNGSDYQLNLMNLPDGIYFLVIEGNDEQVTKKLVKK